MEHERLHSQTLVRNAPENLVVMRAVNDRRLIKNASGNRAVEMSVDYPHQAARLDRPDAAVPVHRFKELGSRTAIEYPNALAGDDGVALSNRRGDALEGTRGQYAISVHEDDIRPVASCSRSRMPLANASVRGTP